MTAIYRGKVTRVESRGVHVLLSDLHPTSALLCRWQGGKPSVGASVLVADTSDSDVSPDLTVIGTGGMEDDGIPRFGAGGSLLSPSSGPDVSWVVLGASGRGVLLRAGVHEVQAVYSGGGTSGYVGTNRPTRPEHPANAFVTKGYVDAIKAALAASSDFADFKARVAAL